MEPDAGAQATTSARRLFARIRSGLKGWSGGRGGDGLWRGAAAGVAAAAAGLSIALGVSLHTGLGAPGDVLLCALLLAAVGGAIAAGLLLASALLRLAPRPFLLVFGGLLGVSSLLYLPALAPVVIAFAIVGAIVGAALQRQSWSARIGVAALGLALLGGGAAWLLGAGSDAHLVSAGAAPGSEPPRLNAPNPGERGPHAVHTLSYGSGNDRRRPEYGPAAALKTEAVDLAQLLPEWSGLDGALRSRYWGFDAHRLPINGRVYYPSEEGPLHGPLPLVLLVHGNHPMEERSDPGLAYLGEHLASRGFIAAVIDENFLNLSWIGDLTRDAPARAWLVLEHLRQWMAWNEDRDNPFHGRIDPGRVALLGHSRGGQAVALAAAYSRLSRAPEDAALTVPGGFTIKAVIALAPTDGYQPEGRPLALEDVDYLVLHGGHDSDVPSFLGIRQYERVRFTGSPYHFKAAVYLYRANHSQFNTAWGTTDHVGPQGWLENRKPRLSGEDQRAAAMAYVGAFLSASLDARREYLAMFRDHRAANDLLPQDVYVTRFDDVRFLAVGSAEEDLDPATDAAGGAVVGEHLSIWREVGLTLRDARRTPQGNAAVLLGWGTGGDGATASYTLTIPTGRAAAWRLDRESRLTFAAARAPSDGGDGPLEWTVELSSEGGAAAALPLSRFGALPPPLVAEVSKAPWLESFDVERPAEQLLGDFEIPLSAFLEVDPRLDPARLTMIRFRFDRSPRGAILLGHVGLRSGAPLIER